MKYLKPLLVLLQVGVSCGLLAFLIAQSSVGHIVEVVQTYPISNILLALASFSLSFLVTNFNWYYILRSLGVRLPYLTVLSSNWTGLFYGMILPSVITHDVTRGIKLARKNDNYIAISLSVFLDRLSGLVVSLSILVVGGFYYRGIIHLDLNVSWIGMIAALGIFSSVVVALVYIYRPVWLTRLKISVMQVLNRPVVFCVAVLITFIVHGLMGLMLYWLCLGVVESASLFYCLFVTEILTLAEVLPISIGGIGIRESLYVVTLASMAVTDADAISIALIQFAIILGFAATKGLVEVISLIMQTFHVQSKSPKQEV